MAICPPFVGLELHCQQIDEQNKLIWTRTKKHMRLRIQGSTDRKKYLPDVRDVPMQAWPGGSLHRAFYITSTFWLAANLRQTSLKSGLHLSGVHMRACARSLCFSVSPVTTAAQKLPFSPFVCSCVWGGFLLCFSLGSFWGFCAIRICTTHSTAIEFMRPTMPWASFGVRGEKRLDCLEMSTRRSCQGTLAMVWNQK